jgi:hypothetical protein
MSGLFSDADLAQLQGSFPDVSDPVPGSPVVAGKLEVPGGGLDSPLVGLPPASKMSNAVQLFCLPVEEIRALYCCGLIGRKKGKVCLSSAGQCSVSSHLSTKFEFPEDFSESEVAVFINVPTREGSTPCVFASPCVAASALCVPISEWRSESAEVKDWQSWLTTMGSTGVRQEVDDVKRDLAKMKFDQLPPGKTPMKKLRYLLPNSPREDDWEGVFPTPEELPEGSSLDLVVGALKAGWPIMVKNAEEMNGRLMATRSNIREFQTSVSSDMTKLDFHLQDLTGFLGIRPFTFDTMSTWDAISDSASDLAKTATEVTSLGERVSNLSTRVGMLLGPVELFGDLQFNQKLDESMVGAVASALGPLKTILMQFGKLFWNYTTKNPLVTPGDILERRLAKLETMFAHSSGQSNINPGSSSEWPDPNRVNTGVTWTNPGMINSGGPGSVFHSGNDQSSTINELKREMSLMKTLCDGLRAEIGSDRVRTGGVLFTSLQFTQNWIIKHGLADRFELFLDIVSLLSLSFHSLDNDMDEIKFDEHANKRYANGNGSTNEAIYELSFRKELPSLFGSTPQNGVSKNSRQLPALPSFADWDTQLGMNGARHVMAHNVRQTMPSLRQMMAMLPPEAQAVALELANDADRCQTALASHMTNHFIELMHTSASNEKEVWMLVSAGVREFFRHMAEKRFIAKRLSPMISQDMRAGYFLWGTLQANTVMKEWMAAEFKNHPRIAPMLTLHLFEYRVPTSDYDALVLRVKALEKLVPEIRSVADSARTTADQNGKQKKKG